MKLPRRNFLHLVAGAAAVPAVSRIAKAQTFPSRPITLILPFAAGGTLDLIAPIIVEHMSRALGEQVVVENIVGAGGTIGSTRAMRAPPDGYTIELGHIGTHAFAVALYPNLAYRPDVEFQPIGQVSANPMLIVARKDLPPKDLKEFISFVKANENKLNVSHAGVGSVFFTTCLLVNALLDVSPTFVPFNGGGPAMNALLGGQVLHVRRRVYVRFTPAGRHDQSFCDWNRRAPSDSAGRTDGERSWPSGIQGISLDCLVRAQRDAEADPRQAHRCP